MDRNFILIILNTKFRNLTAIFWQSACVVVLSGLFSCGAQSDKKGNSQESMAFTVDSTLLGTAQLFNDHNLRLKPPRDWIQIDSGLFGTLNQLSQLPESLPFRIKTLALFANKQTGCLLSVLSIFSELKPEQTLEQYIALMKNKLPVQTTIKNVTFVKESLRITQFLIQTEQYITFKLFIVTPELRIIQCDYIIPIQHYTIETAKTIESSIGSIITIHNPS